MTSKAETNDWAGSTAPSLGDFEAIVEKAYQGLPKRFRDLCGDLVIRIEDFPTEDILDSMKIDSPFGLLGLYSGVDLARKSVMDPDGMPDMVFLYRRPILEYWAERDDSLDAIIAHVLVHEIGHHFGLSDDDMHRIESEAAR
jgi:predicted Zn-dependent protease with MMP-like domain